MAEKNPRLESQRPPLTTEAAQFAGTVGLTGTFTQTTELDDTSNGGAPVVEKDDKPYTYLLQPNAPETPKYKKTDSEAIDTDAQMSVLATVDTQIKELRAEIDNGSGYSREKEERESKMALLTGARKFAEDFMPESGQSLQAWYNKHHKNLVEHRQTGAINTEELTQSLKELDHAKMLLQRTIDSTYRAATAHNRTKMLDYNRRIRNHELGAYASHIPGQKYDVVAYSQPASSKTEES